MRNIILGMSALALAAVATPALAQDEASSSGISISANAGVYSEYRFRGVGLSNGDFVIQGGIDASHDSGFYVGTWGSSLGDSDPLAYGGTEIDIYGGWSGEVTPGLTVDVGVLYYWYPNSAAGDFDYWEPYASVSGTVGPVDATFGVAYAPDQDSLGSSDNLYVYTDLSTGVPGTPLSVSGHLGYTDGFLTYTPDGNAWDWSLGASASLTENLSLGVSYTGVEGVGLKHVTDDAVVVSLSASF
ncbi:MAG: TorF family putative porin [Sphingobium sp.]